VPEPTSSPFAYTILRAVPSVERGEQFNVGVVLFCRQMGFLAAEVALDESRLAALGSEVPAAEVVSHLDALVRVAEGAPDGGPIASLPQSERFGWLAAPSSTIVQASGVHTGLCEDPERTLAGLFERLVAPVAPG
jgi:hypothetical protein